MKDNLVRASFHDSVLSPAHNDNDTLVIDELGLKNGQYRADIAVLNGKMIGYEIKTDSDTLVRLKSQIIAYNEVFDRVFIITGRRHLNNIIEIIPNWWGVFIVKQGTGEDFTFQSFRKAKRNKQKVCLGIAQLLWKDEIINILSSTFNFIPKSNMTRHDLYKVLQERCSADELGKVALRYIKNREGWRTNQKALL